MKIKILITTFCFLTSLSTIAAPLKMEMIFLSPKKLSMMLDLIDQYQRIKYSQHVSQAEGEKCVPMGDGCFHPQLGFIEKQSEVKTPELLEEKKFELKNFHSLETNLVDCDKSYAFDIFCGKAKGASGEALIEVWFDISSSLRIVDYNRDPEQCARREFMEKIQKSCGGKVSFSVFNTSLKQITDLGSACLGHGTNDQKKLLRWMTETKAKQLVVVTDIDEMSEEMKDFLESRGAKMTGDGVKAFTATDLVDYAKEYVRFCK